VVLRSEERRSHDINALSRQHKMVRAWGKGASGKLAHAPHGSESTPAVRRMPCGAGRSTALYGKSFKISIY